MQINTKHEIGDVVLFMDGNVVITSPIKGLAVTISDQNPVLSFQYFVYDADGDLIRKSESDVFATIDELCDTLKNTYTLK